MNAERWAQIDHLLDEALARAPEDRAAFLAEACQADAESRREVESLLAAHDQAAAKFLQAPAMQIAAKQLAQGSARSLVGQTLGKYSVLAVLGAGGMGEVYLARDSQLNRKLALKLLPPEFTRDATRVKRFEREAKAASALNHPNIITVYEIGQSAGEHFMAIEYVDGQTLRAKLHERAGRLPLKEALEIAIQTAAALAAAHEAGIVHRDIKPENVMVRRDSYVKVLDFGLAKLTEQAHTGALTRGGTSELARTQPGMVLGTASYMSPEQAEGLDVDQRSDVFSFGVLLYELVTGVLPFKGNSTLSVLNAILHHTPEPVTALNPALPGELEHIVRRALEKDRELRFQSAHDLRANLKRLQRELDSQASGHLAPVAPATAPQRNFLQQGKRWLPLAALLLAALGLGWWQWRRNAAPARAASSWNNHLFTQLTEHSDVEDHPTLAPDGNTVVYARRLNGQFDIFWQRVGGSAARNLTADSTADDSAPRFSRDGQWLAFRSERQGGGLYVMGATGESPRRILGEGFDPAWGPADRELVFSTRRTSGPLYQLQVDSELAIVNLSTLARRAVPGSAGALLPDWSPGGQRIAYVIVHRGGQRDLMTIAATGGQPVLVTDDAALDWSPVWAPGGRQLYFASDRAGRMNLWRVAIDETTGQRLGEPELIPTSAPFGVYPSLSRDERKLAYATQVAREQVMRVPFDPGKGSVSGPAQEVHQSARRPAGLDVAPDGGAVAFYSQGNPQMDLFVLGAAGRETPRQLTNDTFQDRLPRWSPDGRRLAFYSDASGANEIWLINADGSGRRQLTFTNGAGAILPVWAPDGQRLAYSRRQGGAFILEVDTPWEAQTPLALPPMAAGGFIAARWSPDGAQLLGLQLLPQNEAPVIFSYSFRTQQYTPVSLPGDGVGGWLRDNRRVLISRQGKFFLLDTLTKAARELYAVPGQRLQNGALAPDQRFLYFTQLSEEADVCLLTRQ